ncbi:MAG: hypothetical protein K0R54_238 [Clostridiaceae bacterium]|jgi:hypothetical protein|nr:hypothetical protein [Clostridiaceae bacterium]
MAWIELQPVSKLYTPAQIAVIQATRDNTSYADLAEAIALAGISVVTSSLFNSYVLTMKSTVQNVLGAIGIYASLSQVDTMMKQDFDSEALIGPLNMAATTGGTVLITTRTYQYDTGSGNSSTWKVETEYKYNRY